MSEERSPESKAGESSGGEGAERAGLPVPLRMEFRPVMGRNREVSGEGGDAGETVGGWGDRALWEAAVRRTNRLSLVIRALGVVSIGLGLASAAAIWPKVRLLWLIAVTGLGVFSGLLGILLRGMHHRMLREVGREAVGQRLYRTKVHRCRAGMFLGGLMLAAGATLERALPHGGTEPAGELASADAAEVARRVRENTGVAVVEPGETYAEGNLRLRVVRGAMESDAGSRARLQVVLEAWNAGRARKLDLDRMDDIEGPLTRLASLSDDIGNRYQLVEPPEVVLRGGFSKIASLYPGERLRVVLKFERPVLKAKELRLGIPQESFRLLRAVVFEIDAGALGRPGAKGG